MKILNQNPVIKSVRIYEEDGYIKADYRTKPNAKVPKIHNENPVPKLN